MKRRPDSLDRLFGDIADFDQAAFLIVHGDFNAPSAPSGQAT